jgi:hypothetical protein
MVRVQLTATGNVRSHHPESPQETHSQRIEAASSTPTNTAPTAFVDLSFTISVPGINADYLDQKIDAFVPADPSTDCNISKYRSSLYRDCMEPDDSSNRS